MNSELWTKFAFITDSIISTLLQETSYNTSFQFNYKDLNKLWIIIKESIIKAAITIIPSH